MKIRQKEANLMNYLKIKKRPNTNYLIKKICIKIIIKHKNNEIKVFTKNRQK
jgi:hypothetical protein